MKRVLWWLKNIWIKPFIRKVAFIDTSGSISPKAFARYLLEAREMGFKWIAVFTTDVGPIVHVDDMTLSFLSTMMTGGGTDLSWINKLPRNIEPTIFSDGFIPPFIATRPFTIIVIPEGKPN